MEEVAFYNDIDQHALAWTSNLMDAGVITPGVICDKDIRDLSPMDLWGFKRVHLFCGISAWDYALRLAGWPDDRSVWTWSEPCQPFSAAGRGLGFADERYLRPYVHHLVRVCRPAVCFGEQVASKDGLAWLDVIQSDMEGENYAFRAFDLCSAGIGAPHIRQRLFFVADANQQRRSFDPLLRKDERGRHARDFTEASGRSAVDELADAESLGLLGRQDDEHGGRRQRASRQGREAGELEHAARDGWEQRRPEPGERSPVGGRGKMSWADPTNGFWRNTNWLFCSDHKWRPVESTHVRLASGTAANLGRMCADQRPSKEGEVDANMPDVRRQVSPARLSVRKDGSSVGVFEENVLLGPMRSETPREESLHGRSSQQDQGASKRQESVRSVRSFQRREAAPCPPQGRESDEQHAFELDDVVRLLSPSRALAALYGRYDDEKALRLLCAAIEGEGRMHNAFGAVEAVWASLGEEAKDRLRLGFDASQWEIVAPFPLVEGAAFKAESGHPLFAGKSRSAMLKGYGNAINVELAAEFIRAYLEIRSV